MGIDQNGRDFRAGRDESRWLLRHRRMLLSRQGIVLYQRNDRRRDQELLFKI